MIRIENEVVYLGAFPVEVLSDSSLSISGFGRFGGEIIELLADGSLDYAGVKLSPERKH